MRQQNEVIEQYRVRTGRMRSKTSDGNNGVFEIPHYRMSGHTFHVVCSDGRSWEHVSVSVWPPRSRQRPGKPTPKRPDPRVPTWEEMCWIKDLFWDVEERVVQYHPPKSEYVNTHPAVLHLWKPVDQEMPAPPPELVGVLGYRGVGVLPDGGVLVKKEVADG
jgi:hypothetical protein